MKMFVSQLLRVVLEFSIRKYSVSFRPLATIIFAVCVNVVSLWQPVGLGKIAKLINMGKIDSSELITMKTLKVCILIGPSLRTFSDRLFIIVITFVYKVSAIIGRRSNRETDRRWGQADGTWF